jgi:hypothetical protein
LRLAAAIGIAKRKMTSQGRCLVSCTGSTDAVSGVASDKLRVEIAMHSTPENAEGTDFRISRKFGSLSRSQGSITCFSIGKCIMTSDTCIVPEGSHDGRNMNGNH